VPTPFPFPAPPVGTAFAIADHVARAEYFVRRTLATADEDRFNWFILSAVYAGRAAYEIAAEDLARIGASRTPPDLNARARLDDLATAQVPRFQLIGDVRVHDFHRAGVRFRHNATATYVLGPMSIRASPQATGITVTIDPDTGTFTPQEQRGVSVRANRSLQIRGLQAYDDEASEWVLITDAVAEYLHGLKPFLATHVHDTFQRIRGWAQP
jgi:hypothetical protein